MEMPSVQVLASRDRSSLEMINKTAGLDITVWLGSSGGGSLGLKSNKGTWPRQTNTGYKIYEGP